MKALEMHYYTVQRFVGAFNGLFNQVKMDWGAGQNDVDILMNAMTEWAKTMVTMHLPTCSC